MKTWPQRFIGAIVAAGCLFAAMAPAKAETCSLELKRLEQTSRFSPEDYMFRATSPQHFFMHIGGERPDPEANDFSKVVKKEIEKYNSEHPFRGVAKLGNQQFGFVLDEKDDKANAYGLLYFDFNHNGDLTDDKIIKAGPPRGGGDLPARFRQDEFPRVDITLDVDGAKVEYGFFINASLHVSGDHKFAYVMLNAAAYREGRITLDGKPRRVVLIDFNSNGRFDDETKIEDDPKSADGQVDGKIGSERGDVLLVDPPRAGDRGRRSPYDVTTSDDQHHVSKLVNIDGKFYDLTVSPGGDKLTLTASSVPVGRVTNPNRGYRAVVYGDKGVLTIRGDKSNQALLPEGNWKLLAYTIDQTENPESPEKKEPKKRSLLEVLASALLGSTRPDIQRPKYTCASAQGAKDSKPVAVRAGETVEFPFGPPYKPIVTVVYMSPEKNTVVLAISLVGSNNEICSDLTINGRNPGEPKFTISTPDGKEVVTDSFEYG